MARYYRIEYDTETKRFTAELNTSKRTIAESLDGSYMLKTDRNDLSAEEA
ncbi:hypothetical protein ACFL2Q_08430 [Thermodesulfobacteriota bacterium]